jgi:hypothetical protein
LNGENRHAGVEEGDPASFAVEAVIAVSTLIAAHPPARGGST